MKKGTFALAGVTAMLVLPVAATGSSSGAAAKAQGGDNFRISFTLQTKDGEPTALKDFRFSRLDAECDGGRFVDVRGQLPLIKVNDRNRFSDSLRRPNKRVRVKGRVSGDLDTVRGRIRAQGDFAPTAQNCDSGKVPWRAGE